MDGPGVESALGCQNQVPVLISTLNEPSIDDHCQRRQDAPAQLLRSGATTEISVLKRRTFLASAAATVTLPVVGANAQESIQIGRMLISGFRGTKPGDPEVDQIRRYLESGQVSGVLLLQRNVASPEQIITLCQALREAAGPVKPMISIDQEGGRVARLGPWNGFKDWKSASDLAGSDMSDSDLHAYYLERARELAVVGINVNFGPVLDLNINPANLIIGALGRSYGSDPSTVVRMATQFAQAHREAGVRTCLKHFPGHGSSTSDSHMRSVDISTTWADVELTPFRAMSEAGLADGIMMGHVYHPSFSDKMDRPASLSVSGIRSLRELAKYDGPVFTDDMQMGAIAGTYAQDRAAILALNAGNSFLIYSNYQRRHTIETVADVAAAISVAAMTGEFDALALAPQHRRAAAFLDGLI